MERDKTIYRGNVVTLTLEEFALPDGRRFESELVHHPGGAAVAAIDETARICLIRQYRHVAQGWLWELPAGKLEPDESPEQTARRELLEESGVAAESMESLGTLYSSPGVFTEVIHLFLSRDFTVEAPRHQEDEQIEVHWVPFPTALAWAYSGEISDAKTIVGLMRANAALAARH